MLSSLNLGVKTQKYFVSSSDMFLDKKTLLKIWLNPGLRPITVSLILTTAKSPTENKIQMCD